MKIKTFRNYQPVTLHMIPEDVKGGHGQAESWLCIDCGFDTLPGHPGYAAVVKAFESGAKTFPVTYTDKSEVYTVRDSVWERAGSPKGCLCVACIEKRIGRKLKPKDFPADDPLNWGPASPRLASRMKRGAPK